MGFDWLENKGVKGVGFVFEHKKKAVIAAEQKYDARRKHKRTTKKAFVFFFTNGEYLTKNGA